MMVPPIKFVGKTTPAFNQNNRFSFGGENKFGFGEESSESEIESDNAFSDKENGEANYDTA